MQLRIGDIEFRHNETDKAEIVQWWKKPGEENEYCITLVLWNRGSEGYDVRFIGDRPFNYDDVPTLWALMKYGQRVLDALSEFQEVMDT